MDVYSSKITIDSKVAVVKFDGDESPKDSQQETSSCNAAAVGHREKERTREHKCDSDEVPTHYRLYQQSDMVDDELHFALVSGLERGREEETKSSSSSSGSTSSSSSNGEDDDDEAEEGEELAEAMAGLPMGAMSRSKSSKGSFLNLYGGQENEMSPVLNKQAKSGDIGTFLNMIKANIGSGILGMPYAFLHGGVILGGITVFVLMCIAVYCVHSLVLSKEYIKSKTGRSIRSYAEVAKFAYKKPGQWVVEATLLFCQFGFCISYLIFMGENLHHLFPFMQNWFWILVTMVAVVPFCLIRNPKYLAPTALTAVAVLVASASIILYFDYLSLNADVVKSVRLFNIMQYPVFIGISIFSFEGIGMALPIHENMKNGHSTTRFSLLLLLAMFIITMALAVFGIFGYMAFGENVRDVITLNLPDMGLITTAVTFGLMVSVFFTYPFAMFPLAEVFDTYLRNVKFRDNAARTQWFQAHARFHLENAIRIFVIGLSAVMAIVGQKAFGLALSIVGGLGGSCIAFIFPMAIYLRTCRKELKWYTTAVCVGIIIFGIVSAVLTTVLSARDIVDKIFG